MFQAGVELYNYMDTFFCCTVTSSKEFESVITEHMLVYVISGELDVISRERQRIGERSTGMRRRHLQRGQAYLIRRNCRAHKIEYPSKDGTPFKGLFLQLKVPMLRKTMNEYGLVVGDVARYKSQSPYVMLPDHPLLKGMFKSLEHYFDVKEYPSERLMEAKIKEVILTLIETMPELKSVLFDFVEPWKIDLADFMNSNYTVDLDLEGFAHYTGRSLSSFKKDFEQAFQTTPMKWIVSRRLEEAHRLIEEENERTLDVYLRVGFKNLSHFSTAYKRKYGYPPSAVQTE